MRTILLLAVLVSAPALAKDRKPIDPDKKICRAEQTTGSIMGGHRVCHTYREWQEIDQANAVETGRMRDTLTRPNQGS